MRNVLIKNKTRTTGQWKRRKEKEKKKRNLNTVEHSIKKRTFLGKIESAGIVTKEKLNIYLNSVNFN